jgi:FkbM family methyltransferase
MRDNGGELAIKDILDTALSTPDKAITLEHKGPILIYGAGETGRRINALLRKYGIEVTCFLDINSGKIKSIDEIPVIRPEDYVVDDMPLVIVALFNHITNVIDVMGFLNRLGFSNLVPYTEFFMWFADELPVHYWLGPPGLYASYISELTVVFSMLEDQVSKELFLSLLRFRTTGNPKVMPPPQFENIYFPDDISDRSKPDRLVDCGAFDGDTLISIKEKFGRLESIRAFEPDQQNYRKLVELNKKNEFSKDTVLIPCGVWSSTVQLRFDADNSLASSVSDDGGNIVQCLALDDCLSGYKPTLIKMDIEGSEFEALCGSKNIIMSTRPDLVISVYHTPDHLWKIPLLVKEMVPAYKCFLRAHGANGYDTVFYAHI